MSTVGDLAGRSPLSVAAACIYMASYLLGKPKTPKEISMVAGVSDGTIRTAYKYLYQERGATHRARLDCRGQRQDGTTFQSAEWVIPMSMI